MRGAGRHLPSFFKTWWEGLLRLSTAAERKMHGRRSGNRILIGFGATFFSTIRGIRKTWGEAEVDAFLSHLATALTSERCRNRAERDRLAEGMPEGCERSRASTTRTRRRVHYHDLHTRIKQCMAQRAYS